MGDDRLNWVVPKAAERCSGRCLPFLAVDFGVVCVVCQTCRRPPKLPTAASASSRVLPSPKSVICRAPLFAFAECLDPSCGVSLASVQFVRRVLALVRGAPSQLPLSLIATVRSHRSVSGEGSKWVGKRMLGSTAQEGTTAEQRSVRLEIPSVSARALRHAVPRLEWTLALAPSSSCSEAPILTTCLLVLK